MAEKERGELIRRQILRDIRHHPADIAAHIMAIFSISRQAVSKHLKKLVDEQWLIAQGATNNRTYTLGPRRKNQVKITLNRTTDESRVFFEHFSWVVEDLPSNIDEIIFIGFTEMVNNAIDHSQGTECTIDIERSTDNVLLTIIDNGEGIFRRIKREFDLYDERQAIFELSKGKLTTDPENHSGQGIFFTSRMFDRFLIESSHLSFFHDEDSEFNILEDDTPEVEVGGTGIVMEITLNTTRTAKEVYDAYTGNENEDYGFNKTVVPVSLSRFGQEQLVSRSQAKRLLSRIENFKIVVFDFQGIDRIGQAFADEIFRVYALKNPDIQLLFKNENTDIENMIQRSKYKNG